MEAKKDAGETMIELVASTLRLSAPLLFAATGGLLCERSGIATICLEGVMLTAAWTAAAVNLVTHNPWLGLLLGMMAGSLVMGVHAFLTVTGRADQIVSGVAVNIFAAGITPLLTKVFFGSATNSPSIPLEDRLPESLFPGIDSIPLVGELLNQSPLIYLALLMPFLVHLILYRTTPGLRLIAAGDGPEALQTSGVSPTRVRYLSLMIGGAIASLGGIYLSIGHSSQFTRDMTSGRGFIALAAVIFGKWRPLPTFLACLFFGFGDALQIQLQSTTLFGLSAPVQFIQALPYLITLIVLVVFVGHARPPLSIGAKRE
jgi:general nucleoside transport system permease protein